ncbi:hypothetical protein [Flaviaesturariibacter amylovorans]|uniref:Uncharacterized protein n=1 Tax=Flaviaesturariibacter amylovorans TaxID=1084520 RepID=A0ABP8G5V7_9BACT
MNEQPMNEQESLRLITEMIGKAKKSIHETGVSAMLWGSVIALCGFVTFAEMHWRFYIGFDVWVLTLLALLPQVFISIRERKQRRVLTHTQEAMNAVWLVYGLSIFALVFYFNTVTEPVTRELAGRGIRVFDNDRLRSVPIPSHGSLLLLLYGIPTLVTGIAQRFRPMKLGAVVCYACFVVSCYVTTEWDMFLNGIAGVCNWLIPGLILWQRHRAGIKAAHV